MSRRFWLLVEWADDMNVVPSYSVIRSTAILNDNTEPSVGKYVMVDNQDSRGRVPRRAQVLKISGSRSSLEGQKLLLEKQDLQMQNVVSMFMRTMTEMKSQSLLNSPLPASQSFPTSTPIIPRGQDNMDDSESDVESENNSMPHWNQQSAVSSNKQRYKTPKQQKLNFNRSAFNNKQQQQQQPTVTYCNQGTQIDSNPLEPWVEQLEAMVKELFTRFQMFVLRINQEKNLLHAKQNQKRLSGHYRQSRNQDDEIKVSDVRSVAETLNSAMEAMGPVNSLISARLLNHPSIVEQVESTDNTEQAQDVEMDCEEMENPSSASARQMKQSLKMNRLSPDTSTNIVELKNEIEKPSTSTQVVSTNSFKEAPLMYKAITKSNNTAECRNEVEMVPIGSGHTLVPARIIKDIDWNSHGQATRLLLQAIFPRKILATHSLTGKKSPAFPDNPPKKQLDPNIIEDIVNTVSERCAVSKRLVRNSITIKCTDECKLYRNRMDFKQKRFSNYENQENLAPPPPPPSALTPLPPLLPPLTSDESSNELAIYL